MSNQVLQAIADELSVGSIGESRRYVIQDAFDPNDVTIIQETTEYPGMGFSPETTAMVSFSGSRCRAFDILCGKVNAK